MLRRVLVAVLLAVPVLTACQESAPTRSAPASRLNLNHATLEELEALPAIGPKHARSIMASRNARGGKFKNLDELLEINGIGAKTLAAIRPYVVVE